MLRPTSIRAVIPVRQLVQAVRLRAGTPSGAASIPGLVCCGEDDRFEADTQLSAKLRHYRRYAT